MIRHDDILPDCPTMTMARGLPFFDKNVGDLLASEDLFPLIGACCDEVDRILYPNSLKPSKVLAHAQLEPAALMRASVFLL